MFPNQIPLPANESKPDAYINIRMAAVLRHLPGWTLWPHTDNACYVHTNGGIRLRVTDQKQRFTVYLCNQYRTSRNIHFFSSNNPIPCIRFNPERKSQAIAADIQRRLIPDAMKASREEKEYIQSQLDWYTRREKAAKLLIEQFNGYAGTMSEQRVHSQSGSAHRWQVTIHSGDSFSVEIQLSDLEDVASLIEKAHYGM